MKTQAPHAETHCIQPRPAPFFQETHCSQCGIPQGPGNSGYSHCADHADDLAYNELKNSGALMRAEIDHAHRVEVQAGMHS